MEDKLSVLAPPPRGLQEPRLPVLGEPEFQHLCYLPTVQEAPWTPVRARHCLQEVRDAEPGPPSAPSHRGGLRLSHAGRHPRKGTHPASNGLRDFALLGAASPRSHAARRRQSPRGPATPGEEQKGPGPRPPPATPIASRGAAHRAPPLAPGPREMAAAPQNGSRLGGRAAEWRRQ